MNATELQACPRIYTRCPACKNDTLTINNGHLLCTWHECPDPTRIDRAGDREPEAAQSEAAAADSLQRVVVRLTREEISLLCGALGRYADGLAKNATNYRATASEYQEASHARMMWSKVAIRCERDARKQYERLKELKALAVKMPHNDPSSATRGQQ